jgi:hypothetical protein
LQTYLCSSSSDRERLIQYIQDSATLVILDCLFQHIPVEIPLNQSLKKKDAELSGSLSKFASAAFKPPTLVHCCSLWNLFGLLSQIKLHHLLEQYMA